MRKLIPDKFYLLGVVLILSLSAFSFIAVKKVRSYCMMTQESPQIKQAHKGGEMFWDILSHEFVTAAGISQ